MIKQHGLQVIMGDTSYSAHTLWQGHSSIEGHSSVEGPGGGAWAAVDQQRLALSLGTAPPPLGDTRGLAVAEILLLAETEQVPGQQSGGRVVAV